MKILPSREDVIKIAEKRRYDILPLSCEILSDFITPVEAMRKLKYISNHCFLLESAKENDAFGRYTFLGFDPKLLITCRDGEMKIGSMTEEERL